MVLRKRATAATAAQRKDGGRTIKSRARLAGPARMPVGPSAHRDCGRP
jgi:hypothetical protein